MGFPITKRFFRDIAHYNTCVMQTRKKIIFKFFLNFSRIFSKVLLTWSLVKDMNLRWGLHRFGECLEFVVWQSSFLCCFIHMFTWFASLCRGNEKPEMGLSGWRGERAKRTILTKWRSSLTTLVMPMLNGLVVTILTNLAAMSSRAETETWSTCSFLFTPYSISSGIVQMKEMTVSCLQGRVTLLQ